MCDEIGTQVVLDSPSQVQDTNYFLDILHTHESGDNWVYEEMWLYFQRKNPHLSLDAIQSHLKSCRCDVLEVYCSANSQLTHQCQALGLKALRFGLAQGDLSTFAGRSRLYDIVWTYRPRHIWTSPKCGPWSAWNRLNMNKSVELEQRILHDRRSENVHLWLCDALFRLQDWRHPMCHFHLEQPQGSELVFQKEMQNVYHHTLQAICDMCTAGNLRHPHSHEPLRKRTQILTTSKILWRTLEQFQCVGTHQHDVIAGSCHPSKMGRMPLSQYTEMYTAVFGRRVSRALRCSSHVQELAADYNSVFFQMPELAFTARAKPEDQPAAKRRRLAGKFHPEQLYVPGSSSSAEAAEPVPDRSPSHAERERPKLLQILHLAEQCAPRVGKVVIQDGPIFQHIQELYPDKQIVALDICRGINRMRVCPVGAKGTAPFRRVIGKHRADMSLFADESWESWEELSRRQQIRNGNPAKLLITIFATAKRHGETQPDENPESKRLRSDEPSPNVETAEEQAPKDASTPNPHSPVSTNNSNVPPTTSPTQIIRYQQHGPNFQSLDQAVQQQIKKMHQNLGHPDNRVLQLALRRAGWPEKDVKGCADFQCPVCAEHKMPKASRASHLHVPRDFNDHVSFDGAEWTDPQGKSYGFYHFIDSATNFHVAIPYQQRTTESLIHCFNQAWIRWAGPPKEVMFDSATESNSDEFSRFLQEQSIQSYVIPTEAHWQLGRAERHGSILKHMIDKYQETQPIQSFDQFEQCLIHLCNAKNAMSRHEGYTPELSVFGKMRALPGNNISAPSDSASFAGLEDITTEGAKFQTHMARREAARLAFVKADHSASLRRALHSRSRPDRVQFNTGDFVMYWRAGKGVEPGTWKGPARVLMVEDSNLIWLSHLTRLYRCAPEHVRLLSEDEAKSLSDEDRQSFNLPERHGSGVFQFRELSQQGVPVMGRALQDMPNASNSETIIVNPNTSVPENSPHIPPSVDQPDTEPDNNENDVSISTTPHALDLNAPVETPIPEDGDDELHASHQEHDYWEICGDKLLRHHVQPRLHMFFPTEPWDCPVPCELLGPDRRTKGIYLSGYQFQKLEQWRENPEAHMIAPEPWKGYTQFAIQNSDDPENQNFHVNIPPTLPSHNLQCTQCEIILTMEEVQKCLGKTYSDQETFLASAAKRQKVEVKLRDLSPSEIELFKKAKDKEIDSWLSTDTVRKILRSKVPEGQLLRSRWVLTWKPLDEVERAELGISRKAKARLVILGFEDPAIDSLPRDSPTLGKDSRMLALQCIASHQWNARSFDIRTAFLRGSRQDSRILGVEPPAELRLKMKLQDNEVCELLKGAYGLVNAPLLWYCELKSALLSLGFVMSPMDPCLFVLPKKNNASDTTGSKIHGVLGVHVDDGIGGGDAIFAQAIKVLEKRFPFGSQRQGSFTFTGINLKQDHNGDIILNQRDYVNEIPPINISRDRRKQTDLKVTTQELQDLRGLIGSLQYAASNTRPDLACRLSLLQAKVTCATIADLFSANKLLDDAKRFSDTCIRIQSLPIHKVRFLSFSDAAFATREKAHSQKGCLILATTDDIEQTRAAPVSPLVWFSNRVVSSTLASETFALSGALDLLSWTRVHWAWLLDPAVEWKTPEITLRRLPPSFAVVDCKSLFDLLQKTSIPQCTEHRTTLEALVIKERLQEGVLVKWVHSAAQMADSLTKDMDTTVLRSFLRQGQCVLHDIDEILKQRADKKIRQKWYEYSSADVSTLHVLALAVLSVD